MITNLSGQVCAVLCTVILSIGASLIKFTGNHLNIYNIIFYVFLFTGICALIFSQKKELKKICAPQKSGILLPLVFAFFSVFSFLCSSHYQPLITGMSLVMTFPLFLWIALLFVHKQFIPLKRLLIILCGFVGIILLINPIGIPIFNIYSLWGLFTGVFIALFLVFLNQAHLKSTPQSISRLSLIGLVISALFLTVTDQWVLPYSIGLWSELLLLGFIFFIGFSLFAFSLKKISLKHLTPYFFLLIIISGVLDWIFFETSPLFIILFGSLLIILSGIISLYINPSLRISFKK